MRHARPNGFESQQRLSLMAALFRISHRRPVSQLTTDVPASLRLVLRTYSDAIGPSCVALAMVLAASFSCNRFVRRFVHWKL